MLVLFPGDNHPERVLDWSPMRALTQVLARLVSVSERATMRVEFGTASGYGHGNIATSTRSVFHVRGHSDDCGRSGGPVYGNASIWPAMTEFTVYQTAF